MNYITSLVEFKMLKRLFFTISILSFSLLANKTVILSDIINPDSIVVSHKYIFITERATIYVFSKETLKLINKFGKQGAGPQEFVVMPGVGGMQVIPYQDHLQINSLGKISFYSHTGSYIKEVKNTLLFGAAQLFRINDKYAGVNINYNNGSVTFSLNILDSSLNIVKNIILKKLSSAEKDVVLGSSYNLKVYKQKIFTSCSKEFLINVFNHNGKKINAIKQEYSKQKFRERDRKSVLDWYKNHPLFKQYYHSLKKTVKFPATFPVIRNFYINNNKIYIQTYDVDDKKKTTFVILDIKGKLLEKKRINIVNNNPLETIQLFDIYNEKVYQLSENKENDCWTLDISNI